MATFGKTDIGAVTGTCDNCIMGSVYTCPEVGTAQSITAYILQQAGFKFKCSLYLASDMSLVGVTEEKVTTETKYDWLLLNFPAPKPSLLNVPYLLDIWSDSASYVFRDTAETRIYKSLAYNNFPNPLVDYTSTTGDCSIYCTYTPAEAAAARRKPCSRLLMGI